jgi:hypothetical protein
MLPVVTKEVILAYVDPASRPFDVEKATHARIDEIKEDQPDLAHFLSEAIKVFETNFGPVAAASAAQLACMMYTLLKRQAIANETEEEQEAREQANIEDAVIEDEAANIEDDRESFL